MKEERCQICGEPVSYCLAWLLDSLQPARPEDVQFGDVPQSGDWWTVRQSLPGCGYHVRLRGNPVIVSAKAVESLLRHRLDLSWVPVGQGQFLIGYIGG